MASQRPSATSAWCFVSRMTPGPTSIGASYPQAINLLDTDTVRAGLNEVLVCMGINRNLYDQALVVRTGVAHRGP